MIRIFLVLFITLLGLALPALPALAAPITEETLHEISLSSDLERRESRRGLSLEQILGMTDRMQKDLLKMAPLSAQERAALWNQLVKHLNGRTANLREWRLVSNIMLMNREYYDREGRTAILKVIGMKTLPVIFIKRAFSGRFSISEVMVAMTEFGFVFSAVDSALDFKTRPLAAALLGTIFYGIRITLPVAKELLNQEKERILSFDYVDLMTSEGDDLPQIKAVDNAIIRILKMPCGWFRGRSGT